MQPMTSEDWGSVQFARDDTLRLLDFGLTCTT